MDGKKRLVEGAWMGFCVLCLYIRRVNYVGERSMGGGGWMGCISYMNKGSRRFASVGSVLHRLQNQSHIPTRQHTHARTHPAKPHTRVVDAGEEAPVALPGHSLEAGVHVLALGDVEPQGDQLACVCV